MDDAACEIVTDFFLGGALKLRQPCQGHRAGTDAVLLAAAAPAADGLMLDIGAGVGAAALAYAWRVPGATLGLVEIEPKLAALADENLALNDAAQRGSVHLCDVLAPEARTGAGVRGGMAALVISNPPFLDPDVARASPDPLKRSAHMMPRGGLTAWIDTMLALLARDGHFVLIHRAAALSRLLAAVEGRLGALDIVPILPTAAKAATRVILRGRKGSRAPLTIAPPLVLHEGGGFTARAEAIHRGAPL